MPNGAPLTFAAALPSGISAAALRWQLTAGTGQTLPAYNVLAGGFDQPTITLVFVPPSAGDVTVNVQLNGQTAAPGGLGPVVIQSTAIPLTVKQLDPIVVTNALNAALGVVAGVGVANQLIKAAVSARSLSCGVLTAGLSAIDPDNLPGAVTGIARSAPSASVRGAVPVGELINALLAPFESAASSAFGAVSGSSTPSSIIDAGAGAVSDFLRQAPTLPIAIDISSADVVRQMTPDVTAAVPQVDLTGSLPTVTVPIGALALPITFTTTWTTDPSPSALVPADLPGLPANSPIKPFVVIPTLVSDLQSRSPTSVKLNATLTFTIPGAQPTQIKLPSITVTIPPIRIPTVAVALGWAAKWVQRPWMATIVPDTVKVAEADPFSYLSQLRSLQPVLARARAALGLVSDLSTVSGGLVSELANLQQCLSLLMGQIATRQPVWARHYRATLNNGQPNPPIKPPADPPNLKFYGASISENQSFMENMLGTVVAFGLGGCPYFAIADPDGGPAWVYAAYKTTSDPPAPQAMAFINASDNYSGSDTNYIPLPGSLTSVTSTKPSPNMEGIIFFLS